MSFAKLIPLYVVLLVGSLSCGVARSPFPYNNIDYPKAGSEFKVYSGQDEIKVKITEKIQFKQTLYYARYWGCIAAMDANGKRHEYDVEWKAWNKPERIDFIIKPKRKTEVLYNVMPKGYNIIYLQDDQTAVRLKYRFANNWSLVESDKGKYKLVGEFPSQPLTAAMSNYPLLYLTHVFANLD